MFVDSDGWSGEGEFTQVVLDRLRKVEIGSRRSRSKTRRRRRSDADYNFIANEIFVTFATTHRDEAVTRLLFFPGTKRVPVKTMTLEALTRLLEESEGIGPADYGDEGDDSVLAH